MGDLTDYRRQIDEIDAQLIPLFEKRMDLALQVARYKQENHLQVLQGGREQQVLNLAVEHLNTKEYADAAIRFMSNIMSISRDLQKKKLAAGQEDLPAPPQGKLGYPGVAGSFSEQALIEYFGKECDRVAYEEFEDVFKAIKRGEIQYGIVPIENSFTGAVSESYDLLRKYGFYIVGEKSIRVDQHLACVRGGSLDTIREVYSHAQGLEQCSEFLKSHKEWKLIPFHNTAIAAKFVSDAKDTGKAAICSECAAQLYGLDLIKPCINNQTGNSTRFIIIGRELEPKEGDKVSVVFSLEDEAGTLYRLLSYFAANHINMVKIESRPMKDVSWRYFLYVDFEGNVESPQSKTALELIKKDAGYFKLLGAYKADRLN